MYPENWPKCPSCGEPALDGHVTCGSALCNESGARQAVAQKYRGCTCGCDSCNAPEWSMPTGGRHCGGPNCSGK